MRKSYYGNYDYKCPYCNQWNSVTTTGDIPDVGEEVECMGCKKVSKVTYTHVRCSVEKH